MLRGQGLGPFFPHHKRGAGLGPFWKESKYAGGEWIENAETGKKSWRIRKRGGRFNFKELALKAWKNLKASFFPIVRQKGKEFLQTAADHAVKKGPQYYEALKKDGVTGVRDMFLDNVSTVATDFVRKLSDRGSGRACDALTTVFQMARPCLSELLDSTAVSARSSGHDTACEHFARGSGVDNDLVIVAPIQMALDMVMGSALKDMPKSDRGGILPFIIPAIATVLGATIPQIPKFIQLARDRGKGYSEVLDYISPMYHNNEPFPIPYTTATPSGISRKRGGGVLEVQTDLGTVTFFKQPKTDTEKIIVKREKGKRGRPCQRTYHVHNADALFS
uniref:LO6 n=1 Tax=Barramundi adomavirus TaxID=2609870 RepID=A0A6F9F1U9_9VIRU|nr:TPA_asm: LO6 [Barramundi adomavirus]